MSLESFIGFGRHIGMLKLVEDGLREEVKEVWCVKAVFLCQAEEAARVVRESTKTFNGRAL